MQVHRLFDLNEHIRRVLALNFQQKIWVRAEIAACSAARPHIYLELLEKGEGLEPLAQASAVLWAGDHRRLRQQHGPALDEVLREGLEVQLQVLVQYHERYGLKLLVQDIDPNFTFGEMERQRQRNLAWLREQGLLRRNAALPLPPVLQRIAVLSAETAAGYQDFQAHLQENPLGYAFSCRFFPVAVQGANAVPDIQAALAQIASRHRDFDCAVLLRGGGARLDLAAFDHPELCRTAALMPLPLLTGIGHDVDQSLLDLVAHTALKTPTAVADFLLQHNLFFENKVLQQAAQLRALCDFHLKISTLRMERAETALYREARHLLANKTQRLEAQSAQLPTQAKALLQRQQQQLSHAEALCAALAPEAVLQRGYSLTRRADGQVLRNAADAQAGERLHTQLAEGSLESTVLPTP